jgi:hypothetical protein
MSFASRSLLLVLCVTGCTSTSTSPASSPSPFVHLQGGQRSAIAPGAPLVTLDQHAATWWAGGAPVTVSFPRRVDEDGARWSVDGKSLLVGLGRLNLDTRTWSAEPKLERWQRVRTRQDPLIAAAWFEDEAHVAIMHKPRLGAVPEILIVAVADGQARSRRVLSQPSALVTQGDRLLVAAGRELVLLNLDAEVLAVPKRWSLPEMVRVRADAGMFAVASSIEPLVLLSRNGEPIASWDVRPVDAAPMPGGAVAVDEDGTVLVGCLEGATVRTIMEAESGIAYPSAVRAVGGRVAVVGGAGETTVALAKLDALCEHE